MKKYRNFILLLLAVCFSATVVGQGGVPPYYSLGSIDGTVKDVSLKIENTLKGYDFQIIGSYNPARDNNMEVLVFTRTDLINIALEVGNRSLMAAPLRVGIIGGEGSCQAFLLNPDYLFYGYMQEKIEDYVLEISEISNSVKVAMQQVGGRLSPVGTSWSEDELKQFRILVNYPSFNEPVILNEYSSFEEGVATIQRNLQSRTGGGVKVYEIVDAEKKVAVFGVGLLDPNTGEVRFLELLGEGGRKNIAALPYQIMLEDTKVSMVPGRFFFPFFWSNLSMLELKELRRVPTDLEYTLKTVTQ